MRANRQNLSIANGGGTVNAKSIAILAAVVALAGCAAGPVSNMTPGVTSQNEVEQKMGKPGAVLKGSDGIATWQYPTGPAGLQTYFARFDANGKLLSFEQVLDDAHFARIETGKTTKDGVSAIIGPPYRTGEFSQLQQTAWDYMYHDTYGYTVEQSIMFNTGGVVVGKPQRIVCCTF
jgi:hypothetical protein